MKNLLKFSVMLMIATFVISSCGKYEDGPSISLLPKKTRLTGTYTIDKYVDSDGTEYPSNDDSEYTFEKDGTLKVEDGSTTTEGEWAFKNSKEDLELSYSYGSFSFNQTFEIKKLTNKELWLADDNGDETHYQKK